MARRAFDPENAFWRPLGFLGEIVTLSLLWALCSLPVVTIGSASCALYDAAVHALRRRDDEIFGRFFETFRRELKSGVLTTLLCLALTGLVFLLYLMLRHVLSASPEALTALTLYALLLPFFLLCVFCWVFPLLSRFTFKPLPLLKTAARLCAGHVLRSVLLALLCALGLALCALFVSPLLFVPGLLAWLSTWLLEPVFRPYEEPEAESFNKRITKAQKRGCSRIHPNPMIIAETVDLP